MSDFLLNLLAPQRLTHVVDVGANPIDGDPPYKDMLAQGLCSVTGFEPQAEALATLNQSKGELETYFRSVIDWVSATFTMVDHDMCGLEWNT